MPIPSSITAQSLQKIRNTLSTYPIALDTQDFTLLSSVFTQDVRCDYSSVTPDHPHMNGLSSFLEHIEVILKGTRTQHSLGTQVLDFEDEETGLVCVAKTYFTTNTFSTRDDGELEHVTVFGWYDDRVVDVGEGEWRIRRRKVNMFHPRVRNSSTLAEKR